MTLGRTKVTPPEIAHLWGVSVDKVLAWIHSGELRAINVATKAGGRPRWRIDLADLAAFERRRSAVASATPVRRSRRQESGIIEFF